MSIHPFTLHHQGVQCYTAALSPDGWVLAAGWNDNIMIWNWMTGEEVRSRGGLWCGPRACRTPIYAEQGGSNSFGAGQGGPSFWFGTSQGGDAHQGVLVD